MLAVHRLAHFLEDTHLRHLPESERSALFLPAPDGGATAAAAPAASPTATAPPTARPINPDPAAVLLSAYVTALAPTYPGSPAVGRFYSAPAVAAWLTRTALGVAVADAAAAAADDDNGGTAGGAGATAMDTAAAGGASASAVAASPVTTITTRGATDTAAEGAMDTSAGVGGDAPPLPVVAGAAAHPAVRAAAAAAVAACGLAAPPGGSTAAAAASVAARHVLAWQAKAGGGAAADDAAERGGGAAAAAAAPSRDGGAPLTLADFPSGLATGGTFIGGLSRRLPPHRHHFLGHGLFFSMGASVEGRGGGDTFWYVCVRVYLCVCCPCCAAFSLTYGRCFVLVCFLARAGGYLRACVRVWVNAWVLPPPWLLGGPTTDSAVDAVGGVLRLLHAARLAEVQRDINGALAAVQATTADAQTDNRLWGRGH